MIRASFLAAALGLAACSNTLLAEPVKLARSAPLGVALEASLDGPGARVRSVIPGTTGAALGLREGDVVFSLNNQPVADVPALVALAGRLKAGQRVRLELLRGGRQRTLTGKAVGRPLETYPGAQVSYGAVPFAGGHLRDILLLPEARPDAPVVMLLPGFSCISIEPPSPDHPYRALGAGLLTRGIGYYRVEKPGMGDSSGTPNCAEITYETEVAAFAAAYRHLIEVRGIPRERIFLFGHSLGGLQAPMLAPDQPPRGIAVYGTVLRNWADYHLAVRTFQPYLINGEPAGTVYADAMGERELFDQFYFEDRSPADLAQQNPAWGPILRDVMGWDGGERLLGRNYRFVQALADQNLPAAWQGAYSNVLSIYGESDVVALFDTDHMLIADIVDYARPGTGEYALIPGADHAMQHIGSRDEFRRRAIADENLPQGAFEPLVVKTLADWIESSMRRPPVALLKAGTPPAPSS